MADLDKAYEILSTDGEVRRTMIVVPTGVAVWLAGEKVMRGESQQELINACLYYVRKHGLLGDVLEEFHRDVEQAQAETVMNRKRSKRGK